MTALNYTAEQKFVPTGLEAIGVIDISLVASDDSINSTATDLSGILAGEWVYVTGTAVDDGWHQLDIDSTTNKIVTLSTLTDEASGSAITIYGYKHGNGQPYDLEKPMKVSDQSFLQKRNVAESLSGKIETLFEGEIETWDLTTTELDATELLYWQEFMASVRAGQQFTIDIYGSAAVPIDILNCIIKGFPEINRVSTLHLFTISFKVRIV